MEYLFTSLLNIVIGAITECANYFGTGVLELLTMDIGKKGSLFNQVFTEITSISKVFAIMGYMILAFNFIWQIIKIMTNPQADETPASLVIHTVVAGIGIRIAPTLVGIFENIFNLFYNFLLGNTVFGWSFSSPGKWVALNSVLNPFEIVDNAVSSVAVLVFELIFLLLLSYRLVIFLIEVVERYVILGVLYYTSPLAFSVAGSKSTKSIFSSWIRMVASQLILMVFNVVFFRLFIMGSIGLGSLMQSVAAQGDAAIGYCIAGNLMLYGILYAATKVDSYLNTLGLNVAQAGAGLSSAVLMGIGGMARTAVSIGKTVTSISKARNMPKFSEDFAPEIQDGRATDRTIVHALNNNLSPNETIDGYTGGSGVTHMLQDQIPKALLDKAETNSFVVDPSSGVGTLTFDSGPGRDATFFNVITESNLKASGGNPMAMQGLRIPVQMPNGKTETLIGWAEGPMAKDIMTRNPALEKKMQEFGSLPNQRVIPPSPSAPGVWTAIKEDPTTGKVTEATQYSPATYYPPEPNTRQERIGGQAVHVMDVTAFHANAQQQGEAFGKMQEASAAIQELQSQAQTPLSASTGEEYTGEHFEMPDAGQTYSDTEAYSAEPRDDHTSEDADNHTATPEAEHYAYADTGALAAMSGAEHVYTGTEEEYSTMPGADGVPAAAGEHFTAPGADGTPAIADERFTAPGTDGVPTAAGEHSTVPGTEHAPTTAGDVPVSPSAEFTSDAGTNSQVNRLQSSTITEVASEKTSDHIMESVSSTREMESAPSTQHFAGKSSEPVTMPATEHVPAHTPPAAPTGGGNRTSSAPLTHAEPTAQHAQANAGGAPAPHIVAGNHTQNSTPAAPASSPAAEIQQHYAAMQTYADQVSHYNPTRTGGFIPNQSIDHAHNAEAAFKKNFPTFKNVEVSHIDPTVGNSAFASQNTDAGIISFQTPTTGESFLLAPAAEYQARSLSQAMSPDVRTITASNGTTYFQIPAAPNVPITDMFIKRPNTTAPVITSNPSPSPNINMLQMKSPTSSKRSSNTVANSAYSITRNRSRRSK